MASRKYMESGTVVRLLSLILFIISIILIVNIAVSSELPTIYKTIGYIISILILIPSVIGLIAKYGE